MTEPRRYRATIKPKPTTVYDPTQVSIIQMTIDFIIGPNSRYDGPETIIEETLRDLHLTGLMDVEYRKYEGGGGESYAEETAKRRQARVRPDGATVELHTDRGHWTFVEGREYALETQIPGVERKPRYHRMGFLGVRPGPGPKYLQFSGRGPDRTHDGQYGGTQEIHERSILDALEVPHDEAARYVALTYEQTRKLRVKTPTRDAR